MGTMHSAMRVVVCDGSMVLDIILPYNRCKDDDLLSTLALPQRMCGVNEDEELVFENRSRRQAAKILW